MSSTLNNYPSFLSQKFPLHIQIRENHALNAMVHTFLSEHLTILFADQSPSLLFLHVQTFTFLQDLTKEISCKPFSFPQHEATAPCFSIFYLKVWFVNIPWC